MFQEWRSSSLWVGFRWPCSRWPLTWWPNRWRPNSCMWRWRFVIWLPWPQQSPTRSFTAGWTPISVMSFINCSTRKSWDGRRATGPWRQPRQPLGTGHSLWSRTILQITCLEVRRHFRGESLCFRQEPWMTTAVPPKGQFSQNLFYFNFFVWHPILYRVIEKTRY